MSEINKESCPMTAYYPDLYNWNGVMMDAASYAKHQQHSQPAPEQTVSSKEEPTDTLDAIFDAPQDLRQIAADAIREDAEDAGQESSETVCEWRTETQQLLLEEPKMQYTGSGSYRGSGSFVSSSYLSSYLSSYRTSQRSSGSFRLSSGSLSAFSMLGGYGLDLI